MTAKQKRLLWAGFVFVALIALIVIFITNSQPLDWRKLYELEEYKSIWDSQISEISLRKTVDSANWAVFSDEDLIQTWVSFLNDMEVRRASNSREGNYGRDGGGGLIVEVMTELRRFSLIFKNSSEGVQLEIDGVLYDIREPETIPFDETYNSAIERHGVRTPWD